jgi:phosphatidylserine decarboxylase
MGFPVTASSVGSGGEEEESAPEFPTNPQAYGRPSPPPVLHKYGVRIDASVESEKSVQDTVADHASVAEQLGPRSSRTGISRRGSVRFKPGKARNIWRWVITIGSTVRRHGWLRSGIFYVLLLHELTAAKSYVGTGEPFSVSPWVAKHAENLCAERVCCASGPLAA